MKKSRYKSRFSRVSLTLVLSSIILVIIFVVYRIIFIPNAEVRGVEAFKLLPIDKTITLHGENLKSIHISAYQNNKKIELLRDTPESAQKTYTLQIKPKDLGLTDGLATIKIMAKSGILKDVTYNINSTIDTVHPTLDVLKAPSIVYRGSGGFAVLSAEGADSVFIKLGDLTFQAFKASLETDLQSELTQEYKIEPHQSHAPKQTAAATYYVFFPIPCDIQDGRLLYAVAEDTVGNQNVEVLPTVLKKKKYKSSSITIDDTFVNKVVSPLLNEINISDPEGAFKKVNEEWRGETLKKLINIARNTEEKILWEGRFLQLKNSKVMATYGDKRTYFYKGKPISESIHLGCDLASIAHAPVEAANNGIVRFAGDLSIYGNTVVIDHGLGLMSLYGHLSKIMVTEGQAVKKGEIIAKTGSTGFASGDHLHFGILIHGYEVSPLYWWDQKWIKVNVLDYLKSP